MASSQTLVQASENRLGRALGQGDLRVRAAKTLKGCRRILHARAPCGGRVQRRFLL